MFLQAGLVFMLSQSVFTNTLPFYNPRHHGVLVPEANDVQLGVDVKTSDVEVGVHVEFKTLKETQVRLCRI